MSSPQPPVGCSTEASQPTAPRPTGCADGRVVDVGIDGVVELESPAAGREVALADRRVAAYGHLLAEQPPPGPLERIVLRRDPGGQQSQDGQRRVPDGRLAGFGPD